MQLSVNSTGESVGLVITGELNREMLDHASELLARYDPSRQWYVDLSETTGIDSRGTVGLLQLAKAIEAAGGELELTDANETVQNGLQLYNYEEFAAKSPPPQPRRTGFFEQIGDVWFTLAHAVTGMTVLAYDMAYWFFVAPFVGKGFNVASLTRELSRNGTHAVPILSLVSFLFGLVLSINGAYLLSYWGQNQLIADMVGVGFTRELAPALVGIMLAARSGAAIAAEIGTMEVREEVDAMWTMGMNPAKHLVVPKVTSLALVAPVLSLVSNLVGITGSFMASTLFFNVNGHLFLRRLQDAIYLRDIVTGLGKSAAFGIIIGFVGCWFGHSVEGNAEEVGDATTRSVVWSIVLIIVADGFFSTLFYMLNT